MKKPVELTLSTIFSFAQAALTLVTAERLLEQKMLPDLAGAVLVAGMLLTNAVALVNRKRWSYTLNQVVLLVGCIIYVAKAIVSIFVPLSLVYGYRPLPMLRSIGIIVQIFLAAGLMILFVRIRRNRSARDYLNNVEPASTSSIVPLGSITDGSLFVQNPEEILSSLDPRARAHLKKGPGFKRLVAELESLPDGSAERANKIKKLIDYIQERMITPQ